MRILIVEDEVELLETMVSYLSAEGYICDFATDYSSALSKISSGEFVCIVLDLMLPGGDGMRLLDFLKAQGRRDGVIIISAKNSTNDKIRGLTTGADDYLSKPFPLPELAARLYAIIRRGKYNNNNIARHHEIWVDLTARLVSVYGNEVSLTRFEFSLLIYFISNTNRLISKSSIAEHLSGDMAEMLDNYNFIYSHIKNMKKKLVNAGAKNYLKTVYGAGYRWQL